MKKEVKSSVLEFMQKNNTEDLSNNEFIYYIYAEYYWGIEFMRKWPSVSSITRCRRWVSANYWIWKRTKADKEENYIEEFARQNKY